MNEHAGPACALSVLIVGAFAVLLHDKQGDRPPPKPTPSSIAREVSSAALEPPPMPPAPSRLETTLVAPPPESPPRVERSPEVRPAPAKARPVPPVEAPARLVVAPSPLPPKPVERPRARRPRGGFTVVEAGESLSDVAARVYGSGEAVGSLWRANRDQLVRLDSPLSPGTLLRTP